MSLEQAAKHLAAQGRGPDTQLVHMSPDEVRSLQQLAKTHGGSLTINPKTGLPEAGFLSNILPTVIGAAAVATMGPAALPWVAGGMGALTYANTGSLGKGLMAGLGAYGGGTLANSFMGAGTGVMGAEAASALQAANPQLAASEIGREMGQAGFIQPELAANMNPATASNWDKLTTGFANPSKVVDAAGGYGGLAKKSFAATAPLISDALTRTPYQTAAQQNKSDADMGQRYMFDPGYSNATKTRTGPAQYTPISAAQAKQTYGFADGGDVQFPYGESVVRMANGGASHLGDYSDGGRLLKGPGDGVSDSIPATIGNKRPARLADGEFVVPARIVSELGNGSTDAGARKLYAMLDRVQKARGKTVGKGKVAKNSRADKFLPA
jgi:hypothetical protein